MNNRPIGFFDSGLGGLTCIPHLMKALPEEKIIYFGDTARTPYGSKAVSTIKSFSIEIADFLVKQDVKMIVIACNTVSATSLEDLKQRFPQIPIIGIIEPAAVKTAALSDKNDTIGIIGTKVTIKSGIYEKLIQKLNPEQNIFSVACPAFVPLIEEGIIDHDIMNLTIKYYLDTFIKRNHIDTLVLGCTHYPLIRKNIENIYPNLKIIDPSEIVISTIIEQLEDNNLVADAPIYENVFYASDLSENFINMIDRIFENSEVKVKFKSFDLEELEWRASKMKLEELLEILDIEEPEEFVFYENFADLIESEEDISYDALYSLIKKVDMVTLGEFIETYLDDVLEGIPEEAGIDAYTFIASVKIMLLGLAESIATAEEDEERDELPIFVEELYKFRNWFTRDSIVHMTKENDISIISVPLLEAIISYRIEKLNEDRYSYNFDDCVPYEIDEYIVSYSSAMAEIEDEEEDADPYLVDEEDNEA